MKKLVSKIIAIAAVGIFACSCLCGCFLVENGEDGGATSTPIATDASNTPTGEPPTEDAQSSVAPVTPEAASDSPQPTPTLVAIITPRPVDTVSLGTAEKPARFTMPTELYGVSRAQSEQWFADAVFIGDSITKGWRNYNNLMLEKDPTFFGQTHFFCEGSYGSGHALEPISEDSLHPIYAGEQHYAWDVVRLMEAKKVFLLLGMNDLANYGVDGAATQLEELIGRIYEANPGVEVYVISAMYMYRGSERPTLNNRNLYLYNQRLVDVCLRKGCEFINIASHLIDEDGFITEEYSSDQYVHQTYTAYAVWADILRSLAARHIMGLPSVTFSLPQ